MRTSALFVAKTNIEFFKIYSVSTRTGRRRGIDPVLTFFWTRRGQFFMILCKRLLWIAPEQKNSIVKHRLQAYQQLYHRFFIQSLYTIDFLYRVCIPKIFYTESVYHRFFIQTAPEQKNSKVKHRL